MRGGCWQNSAGSGVFAFTIECKRLHTIANAGFRAASFFRLIKFGDKQRLPFRGGRWDVGSHAGVFAFDFWRTRSFADPSLGFRAASFFRPIKLGGISRNCRCAVIIGTRSLALACLRSRLLAHARAQMLTSVSAPLLSFRPIDFGDK